MNKNTDVCALAIPSNFVVHYARLFWRDKYQGNNLDFFRFLTTPGEARDELLKEVCSRYGSRNNITTLIEEGAVVPYLI